MTEPGAPSARSRGRGGPFLVFGVAALLAAIAAAFELSYYAGNAALSPSILGTFVGILVAVAAFFVWGLRAPPNE